MSIIPESAKFELLVRDLRFDPNHRITLGLGAYCCPQNLWQLPRDRAMLCESIRSYCSGPNRSFYSGGTELPSSATIMVIAKGF